MQPDGYLRRVDTDAPVLNQKTVRVLLSESSWTKIIDLGRPRPWRSSFLYLQVYVAILTVMLLEYYVHNVFFTLLAIVFIAGRQHSLYILNHDASHYSLYATPQVNKVIASIFSNLVMFHHPEAWSFVQWRRVHVFHHMHLFTDGDPNYVGRRMRGDVEREYAPGKLFITCIKNGLLTIIQFFIGRQDYVPVKGTTALKGQHNHLQALFCRFRDDSEMETERRIKWLFFTMMLSVIAYCELWRPFLLLWLLPMYTVYPMILSFMDLTEHRWTEEGENLNQNTRSVRLGTMIKIWISTLPRGLHREHHIYPRVIAADLPRLSAILNQDALLSHTKNGIGLLRELTERHARMSWGKHQ